MKNNYRDLLRIILVGPQLPENTGSVARVMSNFGFTNLCLVAAEHPMPHYRATALAANGAIVLHKVATEKNLNKAIENSSFVLASTAVMRDVSKPVIAPKTAAVEVFEKLRAGQNVSILFGRESSGLTNFEINAADKIIEVDTHNLNRSLNLAQAVAIVCYEINEMLNAKVSNSEVAQEVVPRKDLEFFMNRLMTRLEKTNFFLFAQKKEQMTERIKNMLIKANLNSNEIRIMHGILTALRSPIHRTLQEFIEEPNCDEKHEADH